MTGPGSLTGLAWTLQDAAALADAWGAGTGIRLGAAGPPAAITAPAGLTLDPSEAAAAQFFAFGNQAAAPDIAALAPVLNRLIAASGAGFMAACFAAPALGRTVYQGHLFQDGKLVHHLRYLLTETLDGRVAVIPYETIAAGPAALRARLSALKEQSVALALLDAVDLTQCAVIAAGLEGALLAGGPAWMTQRPHEADPPPPEGRLAILSGALDRQTLFQLGAARAALPLRQLDPAEPGAVPAALAWAALQSENFIISTSTPPDGLRADLPAADRLGEVATGLAAQGIRRFVIAGNDSAAAILRHLGITRLAAGGTSAGLRWLRAGDYNLLLKPGFYGEAKLFAGGFEPQIRLNAAAQ
jgi:uncharacterized protein YgbK (DUF1537 family)